MNNFLTHDLPRVEVFDLSYFVYLITFFLLIVTVIYFRDAFQSKLKWVFISFFFLGLLQRFLILFWYNYNDLYTVTSSLPLQICRVVIWLIIIQCLFRIPILNHIIFYFGLFAAAAFFYPIGIWPFFNIAGMSFFILHAMNVIFPLIMYVSGEFKPSIKGALIASGAFVIYYVAMLIVNLKIDANYFFIMNRPFLNDLSLLNYSLINIVGTTISFIVVAILLKAITRMRSNR